ncbi:unnamed protein product [Gongylonema pulchrum]|uniref:Uncharacterized protein n=1 Tax=Gongylonema pulchrum TaxID=637853 RepID=A0A3P7QZ72_9BILA|nr:unnamed protein product [Gongylonema pulchrum]
MLGIWALHVNDAVCAAVNHKFRMILYGCKNGDIAAFHLDDTNGSLICTYRVSLQVKDGPELLNRMSEVRHVECYAQGTAIAAVWSPLLCDEGRSPDSTDTVPIVAIFSSFGAHLWLAADTGLYVLPLAHSINSSTFESTDRIVFLSDNQIYLSAAKEREQSVSAPHSIWHLVEVDERGQWLVVAGARGFIHYNLIAGKWRMFGNESQVCCFHSLFQKITFTSSTI